MSSRNRSASSYRVRLFVGFTLVIALFSGAWAWSLYGPLNEAVRAQQRDRLTGLARTGAVAISASTEPADIVLAALAADDDVRFTLIDADGTVLADTQERPQDLENHGDRPEVRAALGGTVGYDVRRSETQGVDRMYVAVPATTEEGDPVALRTSESLNDIAALSAETRRVGLALLIGVLVLAAIASWLIAKYASRPVERLVDSATAMAGGDLSSPIASERGPLGPLSSALADLREQLRTRLTDLHAEQDTLRTALNGLADGVLLLDEDRVVLTNHALGRMFRLPTSASTLENLGLPAPVEAAISANRRSDEASVVELGPDPFKRYHRVAVIPLGGGRTLVAIADVSDVMRLDAVRRDFVANASHELKTPTASILLLAHSADQAAQDGDSKQALEFLAQIGSEAERLRRLIAELLDLSRLESTPSRAEVTDVRRAVDLAVAGHRPSAQSKGLHLSADMHAVSGQDVAARCDSTDLAVALDNLLANAIAYTEAGSVVVSVEATDEVVRISVADTGIGVPEQDVERVFERFYRVDRARSRTSGGTGLGLALVRNIAERAGGTARMESAVGAGTRVTLSLLRAR